MKVLPYTTLIIAAVATLNCLINGDYFDAFVSAWVGFCLFVLPGWIGPKQE